MESQGLCYSRVFTDENACLRMCKNCFKVFENLSKKIVSVKEKVSKAASRACRSVSQGHSSNPLATPSRRTSSTQNVQDQSDLTSTSAQVSTSITN